MKYILILLGLYGAYHYAGKKIDVPEPLAYAKKHPQAKWAPALDYYAGLYHYQRSDYPKAQQAFTQLLTDYPTCQYAPGALYRLGDAAEFNHDWGAAKEALERYVEEFPQERNADVARKKLDLLKYRHP